MDVEEIEVCSCVRGYHVYQELWIPVIGEELVCVREQRNTFSTAWFTEGIALNGMEPDGEPFGSGRPSIGLKYCRIDMLTPPPTATCELTS